MLLTLRLWYCDARAVRDQQVHHGAAGDIDGVSSHHVAERHRAAGGHAGGDWAGSSLVAVVGAHVPLELGGRLAVDTA